MGHNSFLIKIICVAVVIVLIFVYLVVHLYKVQITDHAEYYLKARQKYTSVQTLHGFRGMIYDSDGNLLAGNVPCVDIRADPTLVGNQEESKDIARFFAIRLDLPYSLLFDRLSKKTTPEGKDIHEVVIKNGVSLDTATQLKAEIKLKKYKGIFFFDGTKRFYPKGPLLSNVIGFLNTDGVKTVPVTGMELSYNSVLSPGKPDLSVFERARDGIPLAYGNNRMGDEKHGGNIYLTIKEPLQSIVEDGLDQIMEKWHPAGAFAVMVDPKTGSILAMAQRPSFNPNIRSNLSGNQWLNRIVSYGFEPGSIMKPLVIAKVLDDGLVTPETVFDCEHGKWFYGGKILHDAENTLGLLTVSQIIQKSSNIGTAKITLLLGKERLYDLLRAYGFGQETGLPFQSEGTGILRRLDRWDTLSITRFPIGQGILVTPLQLLSAYTALANGGVRMKLRIVDKIEDTDNGKIYYFPIKTAGRIFSDAIDKKMKDIMKTVTEAGGTAKKASIPGYYVAGKTGTAQKWVDGEYSHSKYIASFIGFVPADNPAFILLVSVDEPKGSMYGGSVAAPFFSDIASKALKYLEIPQDYIVDTSTAKK